MEADFFLMENFKSRRRIYPKGMCSGENVFLNNEEDLGKTWVEKEGLVPGRLKTAVIDPVI